jgi:C4-type Zn-finger protein
MKKSCPHCTTELKLSSETHKVTPKGDTETKVFKCTTANCNYKYTESLVTEEGE